MASTIVRDTITGLSGHPMSGLWTLEFESGRFAPIESGYGVRQLAACFGATEGSGDLLSKIVGQEIYFAFDPFGLLEWFTPAADWTGPELPLGVEVPEDDLFRLSPDPEDLNA